MTNRKPLGAYKADETPCRGKQPAPYAAWDKDGRTWRISAEEAAKINEGKDQ